MKKQIGLTALAVVLAFTIGFAPGLARACINFSPCYEGGIVISGTVEKGNNGYVLETSRGALRLVGVDGSKWVGKNVKVWGELDKDTSTDVEILTVDRINRS